MTCKVLTFLWQVSCHIKKSWSRAGDFPDWSQCFHFFIVVLWEVSVRFTCHFMQPCGSKINEIKLRWQQGHHHHHHHHHHHRHRHHHQLSSSGTEGWHAAVQALQRCRPWAKFLISSYVFSCVHSLISSSHIRLVFPVLYLLPVYLLKFVLHLYNSILSKHVL